MNDQIAEILNQPAFDRLKDWHDIGPVQKATLELFAELIVRECMRMCEVTEMSFVTHDCDVEASGAITVKQFIAEHFGVES
jgi:hypothetical protein